MSRILIFCVFLLSFAFYGNAATSQQAASAPSKDGQKVAGKGSSWWQPEEDTSLKADKSADTSGEGDQDDSDDSGSGDDEDDSTSTDEESEDDNAN